MSKLKITISGDDPDADYGIMAEALAYQLQAFNSTPTTVNGLPFVIEEGDDQEPIVEAPESVTSIEIVTEISR